MHFAVQQQQCRMLIFPNKTVTSCCQQYSMGRDITTNITYCEMTEVVGLNSAHCQQIIGKANLKRHLSNARTCVCECPCIVIFQVKSRIQLKLDPQGETHGRGCLV